MLRGGTLMRGGIPLSSRGTRNKSDVPATHPLKKRIGFFAGSFDPVHDGHVGVASFACDILELEKVYLLAETEPWSNKKPANIKHRRKMIDLALQSHKNIMQLTTTDKKFSINTTLKFIEEKFNKAELYFIFGADVFLKMSEKTWDNLDKLFKHYIVVFERRELKEDKIQEYAKELGIVTAIFPEINKHSSTDVRLNPHKKQIWVCREVAQYIEDNKLY